MNFKTTCVLIAILLFATHIFADIKPSTKKSYQTKRIESETPRINGILDDSSWDLVEWSGDFTQHQPENGAEPSQETQFKILYDDDYLYIGVRCFDTNPEEIVQRMSRRDGFDGDWVEINIDSYFDKRTAFSFTASVSGVKGDEAITGDGDNWDHTWDPIWYLKTSIDEKGWIAEIAIPFTQLRFDNAEEQTWGIQVQRRLYREEERSTWQFVSQEEAGWVHHFGELKGIKGIKPKKQIEIAPYGLTKLEKYEKEEGNPYADGSDIGANIGVDGKIGLTNDFTLDFTINPDFGQVEADPSEVNLTAFESYFREKRPFFIEGRNITNFQLSSGGNSFARDNLFYSRRVGRYPQYYPDVNDDVYVDMPESTNILGALKITGKTKEGLSVGVVESFTAEEKAEIYDTGNKSKETVEPATNYLVGRVQKDLNDNNTIIGGMLTSTNRILNNQNLNYLNSDAYTGGIDFTQYWNDKKYYLKGNFTTSHIQGDVSAITSQQESSRRYFQRPDNSYTKYDTTLTSLSGHGGNIQFGKSGHAKWRYLAWITWRSPSLELNDVGFMRHADAIFQVLWAGYRYPEPFGIFRELQINFNQWSGWDFGGNLNFKGGNVNTHASFTNHWSSGFGFNIDGNGISNTTLRGGPSILLPGGTNGWIHFGTDRRKMLTFYASYSYGKGFENSTASQSVGIDIDFRPTDAIRIAFVPDYQIYETELQYMDTEVHNNENKYIFASIKQITTDLTVRFDWTLSPELTIQYYGSPFISAVDYYNPKHITDPHATVYKDLYSTDISFSSEDYENDWDFNFREFRSNLVIRWEYRPGSLLYLVWTQSSVSDSDIGDFSFSNDLNGLIKADPYNVFLVKLSYRIF